jgi:hypothetical protein
MVFPFFWFNGKKTRVLFYVNIIVALMEGESMGGVEVVA